jgi:hypothetical protein
MTRTETHPSGYINVEKNLTQNTREEYQAKLAIFHLQGTWFSRLEQHSDQLQWSEFATAINKRFDPHAHHNHLGQLSHTRQMGEYIR